jgi:hypothetical protein
MLCRLIVIATSLILSISVSGVHSQDSPGYKIYLTNKVENDQPGMDDQSNPVFDCTDRIYLVVEALNLSQEKHKLSVKWLNPVGKQQEKTDYEFDAVPFTRIWAWLQLNGPPGAVIGQVFDPTFGMEEFIGEWSAHVAVDQKTVEKLNFVVVC